MTRPEIKTFYFATGLIIFFYEFSYITLGRKILQLSKTVSGKNLLPPKHFGSYFIMTDPRLFHDNHNFKKVLSALSA